MVKKLLFVLIGFVALEIIVYFVQGQKLASLKESKESFINPRQIVRIPPSRGFGDLLVEALPEPEVLSESVEETPTPEVQPAKKSYVIAAIGDSMVETMGDSLDYLKAALKKKYPNTEFAMYNYGIGAEKVSSAVERFDKPYVYGNKKYAPLTELKPDVLIIGSYAYNPFDQHNRNLHWLNLAELVVKGRSVTKNVYLLAEIAPVEKEFGKGPGGVNWPDNIVSEHTPKIIEQLENAIGISKTLYVPLINVYEKTRIEGSKYGRSEFVSDHDHIHPSVYGQVFTAEEEASVIKF